MGRSKTFMSKSSKSQLCSERLTQLPERFRYLVRVSASIKIVFFWVEMVDDPKWFYLDDGYPDRSTSLRLYLGPSSQSFFC